MLKISIEHEEYILCPKCGKYKRPESYKSKGKKQLRKSCSNCRIKK